MPRRLGDFMDNFFSTCHDFEPDVNLTNYERDIELYGATAKVYRVNRTKLTRAFYDITGTERNSASKRAW